MLESMMPSTRLYQVTPWHWWLYIFCNMAPDQIFFQAWVSCIRKCFMATRTFSSSTFSTTCPNLLVAMSSPWVNSWSDSSVTTIKTSTSWWIVVLCDAEKQFRSTSATICRNNRELIPVSGMLTYAWKNRLTAQIQDELLSKGRSSTKSLALFKELSDWWRTQNAYNAYSVAVKNIEKIHMYYLIVFSFLYSLPAS